MSDDTREIYDTVGPDVGISREDLKQANEIIDIIDGLDTIDREQLIERKRDRSRQASVFDDETPNISMMEKQYRPARGILPGFGERRETCGMEIPCVCRDCGHTTQVGRTCRQSMCPRCAPAWVLDRAPGIVNKIMGAARMMSYELDEPVYKHHVVVSPPKDVLVDAELPEERIKRDVIYPFMDEINFQGAAFYHPFTGKSEVGDSSLNDAEAFGEQHEDDRGEWKKRLFEGRDWHGDVREELEARPHFHLVGACPWVPGGDVTKRIYEETGWIIHRITGRNGSPISLGSIDDVARAVVYVISHTMIDTRGEHNRYVHGKKGAAYHKADDRDLERAKHACHAVSPKLLGIDPLTVSCSSQVPDDDESDPCKPDQEDLDDVDKASDDDEDENLKACTGTLDPIDRADYIHEEDWQERAIYADDALEAWREWERIGGWDGWLEQQSGQTRLSIDESGKPPPD